MITRHINCVYNMNFSECTNENVKKSFFGLGKRHCICYPLGDINTCEFSFKRIINTEDPTSWEIKLLINALKKRSTIEEK